MEENKIRANINSVLENMNEAERVDFYVKALKHADNFATKNNVKRARFKV